MLYSVSRTRSVVGRNWEPTRRFRLRYFPAVIRMVGRASRPFTGGRDARPTLLPVLVFDYDFLFEGGQIDLTLTKSLNISAVQNKNNCFPLIAQKTIADKGIQSDPFLLLKILDLRPVFSKRILHGL